MALRLFLALEALVWLPYGVFCFFQPGALAESAGVVASSATASVEIRAMYGGLQTGIGVLVALSLFRPALRRPALVLLVFLCGGLGLSRVLGAVLDAEMSGYTGFALVFELASLGVAGWLLRRAPAADPALA